MVISRASLAQDYLLDDPRWKVRSMCAVNYPCIATDLKYYSTVGDSVVQSITWTKVIQQGSITYMWLAQPPAFNCSGSENYGPSHFPVKLIRQEGRQLRILNEGVDQLLFDFDLVVGDTLPFSYTNFDNGITVVDVDSVLIGSTMRARYTLGNGVADYLIEGVGSSNGLFEPISSVLECGFELMCYGLGSQAYYPQTVTGCGLPTLIEERYNSVLSLGPVPASDQIKLEANGLIGTIRVINAFGQLVYQNTVNSNSIMIDISHFANGTYTVRQIDGQGTRFVVAH